MEKADLKKEFDGTLSKYNLPDDILPERFAEWLEIEKKLKEIRLKDVAAANALVKGWKIVEMKRMMEITGRKSRIPNFLSVGYDGYRKRSEAELMENIFDVD